MPGVKGKSGGVRTGAGALPKSITLKIGDGILFRYGHNTPMEIGEVIEIKRGIPRTVVMQLRESGERIWLLVETPKED